MKRLIILAACAGWASSSVRADDFALAREQNWHQWRGPWANGVAPHGDPPVRWDENTNVQWKVAIAGEGNSTPIVWGDRVFVTTAIQTDRTVDRLAPPAGEPLIDQVRLPGLNRFYASPVGAAGRVYFVDRSGRALVIKHQPKLEVLAANQLDDPIDASPAIAGKQMFLRGKTHLYCLAADSGR